LKGNPTFFSFNIPKPWNKLDSYFLLIPPLPNSDSNCTPLHPLLLLITPPIPFDALPAIDCTLERF